jgi:hypothetical protein
MGPFDGSKAWHPLWQKFAYSFVLISVDLLYKIMHLVCLLVCFIAIDLGDLVFGTLKLSL